MRTGQKQLVMILHLLRQLLQQKTSSGTKTVLPTGEVDAPARTNYNSKGNSSKKEKNQNKKSSKKSNYNNKTEKKESSRKGELKTKVQETAPKSSTLRKVTRKL